MIATYARTAFAQGYAEVNDEAFPIPGHVAGLLRAALETAAENDSPLVLESVRRSGRESALYVALNRRVDTLEARWNQRLRPILRQVAAIVAGKVVAAFLAKQEAASPQQDAITAVIQELRDLGIWQEWREVTRSAMMEGLTEGRSAGAMWVAHSDGTFLPGFGLNLPQQVMALQDLGSLPGWDVVDSWQAKQVQGLGYQLGRALATAQEAGASYDDMLAITSDAITGDNSMAYLLLDDAIGASTIQGRLSVYDSEGVQYVDLMISPNACPECETLATNNPFEVRDAPEVPVHPRCRCDLVPSSSGVGN